MVAQNNQSHIRQTNPTDQLGQKPGFFMTICISTSFKHYTEMSKAAVYLRSKGFTVLTPEPSHIRHEDKPDLLKEEKYDRATLEKWEAEGAFAHFENIKKADLLYIFNPGSYLGPAVAVEIGYALALEKPIYSYQKISDITLTNFAKAVVTPEELVPLLQKNI
jgi:nucleoside 2-deoxyribosyltransferase